MYVHVVWPELRLKQDFVAHVANHNVLDLTKCPSILNLLFSLTSTLDDVGSPVFVLCGSAVLGWSSDPGGWSLDEADEATPASQRVLDGGPPSAGKSKKRENFTYVHVWSTDLHVVLFITVVSTCTCV